MKKLLLSLLFSPFFLSCNAPKTTVDKLPNVDISTPLSVNLSLSGKWTLVNYSAFMHLEDGESMPKYAPGDVVWDFGKGNDRGRVIVTKRNPKEKNDFSMKSGTYQFWTRECLIKIEDGLYLYSFSNDELVIDSNSDPSLGADSAVLRFRKME